EVFPARGRIVDVVRQRVDTTDDRGAGARTADVVGVVTAAGSVTRAVRVVILVDEEAAHGVGGDVGARQLLEGLPHLDVVLDLEKAQGLAGLRARRPLVA